MDKRHPSIPGWAQPAARYSAPVYVQEPVMRAPVVRRRALVDSAITFLAAVALIAGWVASVSLVEASGAKATTEGRFVLVEVKTLWFYGSHGLAIASVMAAGILSLLSGRLRRVSIGTRIAFFVLLSVSAVWAAISYSAEEALSSEIFGATGPFVWYTLLFVLAGTDRKSWAQFNWVINLLAYLSSILAVRALVTSDYAYYSGFSKYLQYAVLLTWLGGWTLLTATGVRGWRLLIRGIPTMVLLLMGVAGQARSWIILASLMGVIFILLRAKERGSLMPAVRTLALACAAITVAGGLAYMALPEKLGSAITGLSERLNDDTRTQQYVVFFNSVPASDLILGRGPKGTWYWPTFGEYRFFDNGYLWTLFEGGIPILFCYLTILIWPAIRALRYRKGRPADRAAVWLVLIWALALTGLSTYVLPSVNISSYLVSLFAGRCHLLLADRKKRARKFRQTRVLNMAPTVRVA